MASEEVTAKDISTLKSNRFPKDCGYPLCPYYNEESEKMDCPSPIEGSPCQGMRS